MRAGLAGFARSGKTTLFSALTGLRGGPEAKIHLGSIKVPDPRLDKLSAMFKPRKTTPAEVLLADLPGPRSKGAALEADALSALREVDALCLVLRAFEPDADPPRDLRDYDAELIVSDLAAAEQPDYLASLGLKEPARAVFLRSVYALLQQISFFTVGEDEVRAWTIKRGDRAARAAGRIHSDLEKSFVRAEVIHYEDFLAAGNEHHARETGKQRLEGKDYVVHDGDILQIRAGRAKS